MRPRLPIGILLSGLLLLVIGSRLGAQTTINVGAVAANTNTGYILNADGSLSTNGQILVGYFSKSQSELATIIAGWDDKVASFEKYSQLASFFTAIGTGVTNYGSSVPGWFFNSNGAVSGTSTGIATNVLPAGTQLYIWSFGTTNLTSNGLSASSQWGLVTATNSNWTASGAGTAASLFLANVSSSGVLIGNDLSGTSSSNSNGVAMFTQRSVIWTNRAGDSAWNTSSTNWGYAGNVVSYQNGDLVNIGGNASGTIMVQSNGVKPGGMTFSLTNSLTVTGGNIDGSGNLSLSGAGTLTMDSVNSFKGGTSLNGASLVLGSALALGSGGVTVSINSLLQPSASMTFTNAISIGSGASLTISTPSSVILSQSGVIAGQGGLTKSGSGSMLLSQAEVYSGTTLVSSGVLGLGISGSLLSSTNVTVSSGGTLLLGGSNQLAQNVGLTLGGGTVSMGAAATRAVSVVVGNLTLTANSVIDFSALGGASSFSTASIKGLSGSAILSLYNYDPSLLTTHLFDAAGGSDFSSSLLSNIRFFSGSGTGFLGYGVFSGTEIVPIVPVPEPSVLLTWMFCASLLLWQVVRTRYFVCGRWN